MSNLLTIGSCAVKWHRNLGRDKASNKIQRNSKYPQVWNNDNSWPSSRWRNRGRPRSCGIPVQCGLFFFFSVSGPRYLTCGAVMHWGKQGAEWCLCDGACWYYCQLIARVGWMASVLSLEHSLFSLMSRTQSSLQPIAERVFVYWRCSKVRNHYGYEYRWEQYQCCSFMWSEQLLWMFIHLNKQTAMIPGHWRVFKFCDQSHWDDFPCLRTS